MVSQAERERSGVGADAQCPPSAAGSRQGAMQAVGYAGSGLCSGGYGGRQGSGGERGARYTKLSNADGTACCGRVGSRHFQSP